MAVLEDALQVIFGSLGVVVIRPQLLDGPIVSITGELEIFLGHSDLGRRLFRELVVKTPVIYSAHFLDPDTRAGKLAINSGEIKKASVMIPELLRMDPGNANINFAIGLIHSALAEYSHASLAFERALQIMPSSDRARIELARAYIGNKQIALAREQLKIVQNIARLPCGFLMFLLGVLGFPGQTSDKFLGHLPGLTIDRTGAKIPRAENVLRSA